VSKYFVSVELQLAEGDVEQVEVAAAAHVLYVAVCDMYKGKVQAGAGSETELDSQRGAVPDLIVADVRGPGVQHWEDEVTLLPSFYTQLVSTKEATVQGVTSRSFLTAYKASSRPFAA